MAGERPAEDFESDGCSASPDIVGGADLRPACHWHDWGYRQGGCESKRREIDLLFFRNLKRCGATWWLANLYYFRVCFFGHKHFLHRGRKPSGLRFYVWLFFSRYVTW